MKKNFVGVALGIFSMALYASDIKITPPEGGGFSVNSSSGTPVFRVDAGRGTVYIKNLPAELGSVPLCWNATTGELSPCVAGGTGGDTMPPTISTNAPAVATSQYFSYSVTCADDIELLVCGNPTFSTVDLGVKTLTNSVGVFLPLGGSWSQIVYATDMSGNSTKRKVEIQGAETGVALKTFSSISPTSIPVGFDCSAEDFVPSIDGAQLIEAVTADAGFLSGYLGWSSLDGYILNLNLSLTVGSESNQRISLRSDGASLSPSLAGAIRTSLAATTVQMPRSIERYGGGSNSPWYATGYSGNVQYDRSADLITIDVVMECGVGSDMSSLVWAQGVPMRFTARP